MANVAELPDLVQRFHEHLVRVYSTLDILRNEGQSVRDTAQANKLKITRGSIHVKNVRFGYKAKENLMPNIDVFRNLNLQIAGGEHVGIVGLSGAGKSTLAALLMRYYDVDAGSIEIDGHDIRNVKQSDLRKQIAYAPQEPLLFHKTIRENIAYYNKTASDHEIQQAAKAVHAHDFIIKLSLGYATVVGERGTKLSGGQRQRIVLAREILKNAPIIILDEATSALDSESEQLIRTALPSIMARHTALVVAHRLSTVAGLDRIVVMHDGEIVEEGTHKALYESHGRYRSLWDRQTSGIN